jgi:hypothetical protein
MEASRRSAASAKKALPALQRFQTFARPICVRFIALLLMTSSSPGDRPMIRLAHDASV